MICYAKNMLNISMYVLSLLFRVIDDVCSRHCVFHILCYILLNVYRMPIGDAFFIDVCYFLVTIIVHWAVTSPVCM